MKRNVLYIEDNEKIGSWVKEELEQRGFSVQWLLSGEGAEQEVNLLLYNENHNRKEVFWLLT
ncbi:response regulator [Paenibacillus dendritiformis]|uniref:hypothetical protein n=1 Tax=Paenibacillus dendritiformis TaxID=130049 RepID=UPI00387E1924